MQKEYVNWRAWSDFFAGRSQRQLPELTSEESYREIPPSVARSLAIFQLGESGGGTVIEQARRSSITAIDADYAAAIALFVAEEHRHAEILAICVRNLGGTLIRKNWTANLFVFARRLMGLRLKVVVLLAAEVVGLCYYHLISTRLPESRLRSLLSQIVNDERAHLHFHCRFLRSQARSVWRRALFVVVWRVTMFAAAFVVLVDHRRALIDLGLRFGTVLRRWNRYSRYAESLVTQANSTAPELVVDDQGIVTDATHELSDLLQAIRYAAKRPAGPEPRTVDSSQFANLERAVSGRSTRNSLSG